MINYKFTGEFECRLDAKGRLKLPHAIVAKLGGNENLKFTINRGFEKHLMLYPNDVWEMKSVEINQLNIYSTKQRQAIRYFYRGATELAVDASERINIPNNLLEYAGIEQDVILFAYNNQIEVWNKNIYNAILNEEPEHAEEIASIIAAAIGLKDPEGLR